MAAPIKAPYLSHEQLMSLNRPPSPSNSETLDFPLLPHEWYLQNKVMLSIFGKECSIRLKAKLSPKSKDPSISVHFRLKDHSKMLQFSSARHLVYGYDCPLVDKPFVRGYTIKSSRFCPLKIKTDEYPVEREHMEFFETQIHQFIKELLHSAKGDIRMDARARVERYVTDEEAMGIVKEMEGKGLRKDSNGDQVECYDCAVCLEDVQMRWFEGMRLPCNHVFHVKCIARWLDKKNTCPLCRLELL